MSKPLQYRKKPVRTSGRCPSMATSWPWKGIARWCGGRVRSEAKASDHTDVAYWLDIPTLEGVMTDSRGDYVIKGMHGKFYPCKSDIFESTYERVGLRGWGHEQLD